MNIYSIFNKKTQYHNRPFFYESDGEALTYLQNVMMSDADRLLISLRGDLHLVKLGEINFVSGELIPCYDFVSNLDEIFDTIPPEKLKPGVTAERFNELFEKYNDLLKKLNNHKHTRKDGIEYA